MSITIQGKTKTLLATETVQGRSGSITRGGAPSRKVPGRQRPGCADVATHGNWKGKWYSSYDEYFITGILGDSETTKKYYWSLYVNGKARLKGGLRDQVEEWRQAAVQGDEELRLSFRRPHPPPRSRALAVAALLAGCGIGAGPGTKQASVRVTANFGPSSTAAPPRSRCPAQRR